MIDESISNGQENDPAYDTNDPEVPFLQHHIPPGLNAQHAKHKNSRAQRCVEIALKWVFRALSWIWKSVLWNKGFWEFAATVGAAEAAPLSSLSYHADPLSRFKRSNRDTTPDRIATFPTAVGCVIIVYTERL